MTNYFPSQHLRHAEIDGSLVALDLKRGSYFIFDRVGSLMWEYVTTCDDIDDVVATLCGTFSADQARVRADLESFLKNCRDQDFLQTTAPCDLVESPGELPSAPPNFLFVRAWVALLSTVRGLSNKGFAEVYRGCAQSYALCDKSDESALLDKAVAAFRRAENVFLIKSAPEDCLPRSLALFRFLRSLGLRVDHCIGVRRYPFAAHAWVEYHGQALLEHAPPASVYAPLARISS